MDFVYDPSILAIVPSLEVAHSTVESNLLFDQFLTAFQSTARELEQNNQFGITLVHRHAAIAEGQRMIDFGRTLQPIPLDDGAQDLYGHPIRPKSLALRDGVWRPYEYEFGAPFEASVMFLDRIKELVEKFGLRHVGLRLYSPDDPEEIEITEVGGVSIKVPRTPLQDELHLEDKTTFWAFPSGGPKLYRCSCRDTGSSTNPNHNHIEG